MVFYVTALVISYFFESRSPAGCSFAIGFLLAFLVAGEAQNDGNEDIYMWLSLHLFGMLSAISVLYFFGENWPR